ncbi:MAG: hypothetical protein IOD01_12225 [Rhodobacter sp.]|jgi:hypothetical protein|nr:hypothetical protein [Rhodobacter sp.]
MRLWLLSAFVFIMNTAVAFADDGAYLHQFALRWVETSNFRISLEPLGGSDWFSITLREKEKGFEKRHEFEGQGANDPSPFQFSYMNYCDTMTILLTVEYPWRHALPQYSRVLETFAFRASDFAFIDMAFGPVTDIALLDSSHPEAADTAMQPPILVECISDEGGSPFRFQAKTNN